MKFQRLFVLIMLALVVSVTSLWAQDAAPTFRIGVLAQERSPLADGARLAVRQINDAGGVTGADDSVFQLELVIIDPEESLLDALTTLSDEEVVAVIGFTDAELIRENLSTLVLLGAPIFTPVADDTLLIEDQSDLLFRISAPQSTLNQALVTYLVGEFGLTDIAIAQLDADSTTQTISFARALEDANVTPSSRITIEERDEITGASRDLIEANPAVIVVFGESDRAVSLYAALRAGGWGGIFVHEGVFGFEFSAAAVQPVGILASLPYSFTTLTERNTAFVNGYARVYGVLPQADAAAAYDAVTMIAAGLAEPGALSDTLRGLADIEGVQGVLSANTLPVADLSINAVIVRVGEFGAPEVLARFSDGELFPAADVTLLEPTPIVTDVPAIAGVVLTITNPLQNVRSGPSSDFPVIGTLSENEQAPVIGRSGDNEWVVIDYAGQQGWLAAFLVDITGDLNTVPVLALPATALPVATSTPEGFPDLIIESATVAPQPIIANQNFTITIVTRNIGTAPAPQYTISTNLAPNNQLLTTLVPPLAPSASATVVLNGIISTSGVFTSSLIVDPNGQVNEGSVGEQNNRYDLNYRVDRAVINQGTQTLNLGETVDFEGNSAQGDANWNDEGGTVGLRAIFGARLGLLAGSDFNAVTYEAINSGAINRDLLQRTELNVGTLIGVITADGNRTVAQVTGIGDTQIALTWRVYSN